jgi:hypothetical protein
VNRRVAGTQDAQRLVMVGPDTFRGIGYALLAIDAWGTPVIVVAGRSTLSPEQRRQAGIDQIYQLTDLAKWFIASLRTSRGPDRPTRE